jgi:hypothetical protein
MTYTAFQGPRLLCSGDLHQVALAMKAAEGSPEPVLMFDDQTGRQIDLDLHGNPEQVLARLATHPVLAPAPAPEAAAAQGGPGRPRLGVVSREVSLLPRHWEWLAAQPSGASAVLRRLVDEARKASEPLERKRLATEATDRFLWTMAGNLPGAEEASRALYAGNLENFLSHSAAWPEAIRSYARVLATRALGPTSQAPERAPGE